MSLTTILNVVFLFVGSILFAIYLIGKKGAEEDRKVIDPVCGNELRIKDADVCAMYEETIYYFDSEQCKLRFKDDPETYLKDRG